MRKIILLLTFCLMMGRVFSAPSNTISITTPTDATVVSAADETARYNEISTKYNAHSHSDISSSSSNAFTIGDGDAEDVQVNFDGNAQDYHMGIDDTDDDFKIGLGTAVGTTTHIRTTEDGEVTMPLQPSFCAHNAVTQDNLAVGKDVGIIFGTERFDQGGDFSGSVFTAPVTGKYQLNAVVMFTNLDSACSLYQIKIITSNKSYDIKLDPRQFAADVAGQWPLNFVATADMDANDTGYVAAFQNNGTAQTDIDNGLAFFSGFLAN